MSESDNSQVDPGPHPLKTVHQVQKGEVSMDEWVIGCKKWFTEEANGSFSNCRSYSNGSTLTCSCFKLFLEQPQSAEFVANYLSYYAGLKPHQASIEVWRMVRSSYDMVASKRVGKQHFRFKIPYLTVRRTRVTASSTFWRVNTEGGISTM